MSKMYLLYDLQDETHSWEVCLDEAKEWLELFWLNNNDDEMTDEELDEFIQLIKQADDEKLIEYLMGIDYCMEEIEKSE